MSFTRKLVENLLEKVSTDETPLSHVDERELEAELAARVEVRKQAAEAPERNPRAQFAGASALAASARDQQSDQRAAKINAVRARKQQAQQQASEQAFRQAQAQARRQAPPPSSGSSRGPSASAGQQRRSSGRRRGKPDIADHYKTLNLPPTASLTEAKRAFRKLMRTYHPDLAPEHKKKAATELTMRITGAYKAIEDYHSGK